MSTGSYTSPVAVDPELTEIAITINAADELGNSSTLTRIVPVQPIDLNITIVDPVYGHLTNADTLAVIGTVSDDTAAVTLNGRPATVTGNDWQTDITLFAEGEILLEGVARTELLTAVTHQRIVRDVTGPALTINAPEIINHGETLQFDWLAEDLHGVDLAEMQLDTNIVGTTAAGTGSYTVPLDTAITTVVLYLEASDILGNTSNLTHTVYVQPLELGITMSEPAHGLITNLNEILVAGTVSDPAAAVTLNGFDAVVDGNNWSLLLPLTEEGPITLQATATLDIYTATVARDIIRDVTPPELVITAPPEVRQSLDLDYEWLATDVNGPSLVEMRRDDVLVSGVAGGFEVYEVPITPETLPIQLTLYAADLAGNTNSVMVPVNVLPPPLDFELASLDDGSPLDGRWINSTTQNYEVRVSFNVEEVMVTSPSLENPQFWPITKAPSS